MEPNPLSYILNNLDAIEAAVKGIADMPNRIYSSDEETIHVVLEPGGTLTDINIAPEALHQDTKYFEKEFMSSLDQDEDDFAQKQLAAKKYKQLCNYIINPTPDF